MRMSLNRSSTSGGGPTDAGGRDAVERGAGLERFGLVGTAPPFVAAMEQVRRFAETTAHVVIGGETGTGKELVARAIHYLSPRRYKPFVPVNCGALPDNLMENELFGHARGAFTDARESQPGMVGGAHGGTLFLDEIECLSQKGQVALLRFLQDGKYRPLGALKEIPADVRVIAASNRCFDELVRDGSFRQDLLYRLAIMSVHLPPLRERCGDVAPLIGHFLERFAQQYDRPVPRVEAHTYEAALSYDWPGNIRELENTVHRQFLLAENNVLQLDLPRATAGSTPHCKEGPGDDAGSARLASMDMRTAKFEVIERFERDYLETMIAATQGNVSEAAQRAGKERRAFGKLLKKYGIDRGRYCSS